LNESESPETETLRALEAADLKTAVRVFLEAFQVSDPSKTTDVEAFWQLLHQASIGHFVGASEQGEMLGCGALILYPLSAWIAFMAVLPSRRGRGIGNRIMKRLIKRAEETGVKSLNLDATNLGKPLYAKYGFKHRYPVRLYEIVTPAVPEACLRQRVEISDAMPGWCVKTDRDAFGDDRSRLLRLILGRGGKMIIIRHQGFGILWKDKIGPVIAESLEAAHAIVHRAAALGAKKIYVPARKDLPQAFLYGFKEIKPKTSILCCDRMALGESLDENIGKVFASFSAAAG
jgi:GNAT superfamily N-acetyltransferase